MRSSSFKALRCKYLLQIKNSIAKAFSRNKKSSKLDTGSVGEADSMSIHSDASGTDSAMDASLYTPMIRTADCLVDRMPMFQDHMSGKTCDLEDQLHERDVELTESRLEYLASYNLVHQLQESVTELEKELAALKNENKCLKRLLLSNGTNISSEFGRPDVIPGMLSLRQRTSTSGARTAESRLSLTDVLTSCRNLSGMVPGSRLSQKFSFSDLASTDSDDSADSIHRLKVAFVPGDICKLSHATSTDQQPLYIGELSLTRSTGWKALDAMVSDVFMEYLENLDPGTHLGLDAQSLSGYHLADVIRSFNSEAGDTLPATCLSDSNTTVQLILKGWRDNSVDSLVLETLVPKPLLRQYVSLVLESKRLVFCGPTGTGKTFLARKLANHVVLRSCKSPAPESIAAFTLDSKSVAELQQYVSRVVRCCHDDGSVDSEGGLPSVLLVDNLQFISSLTDVFGAFVATKSPACPFFIGTMNQTRKPSTADLQLRQNFRWVLLTPPLDPVAGLLSRHLHRSLVHRTLEGGADKMAVLRRIVDWLPTLWKHINKSAIALSCSSTACTGPALFMSCPMDVEKSRSWFVDVWNNTVMPYLVQLNRDDIKAASSTAARCTRATPDDPASWVQESNPWSKDACSAGGVKTALPLARLKPDYDASHDTTVSAAGSANRSHQLLNSSNNEDPVLAMLLKLQESTNKISSSPYSARSNSPGSSSCNSTTAADLDCYRYSNGTTLNPTSLATLHSAVS